MSDFAIDPCARCGVVPKVEEDGLRDFWDACGYLGKRMIYLVYCYECDSMHDLNAITPEQAVEVWNTRQKELKEDSAKYPDLVEWLANRGKETP